MSNYKKGRRIRSLDELKKERVVFIPVWNRCSPVAFFLSWQWRLIDSWIQQGRIYTAKLKEVR